MALPSPAPVVIRPDLETLIKEEEVVQVAALFVRSWCKEEGGKRMEEATTLSFSPRSSRGEVTVIVTDVVKLLSRSN